MAVKLNPARRAGLEAFTIGERARSVGLGKMDFHLGERPM